MMYIGHPMNPDAPSTADGTSAGATAQRAAVAGAKIVVDGVSGFADEVSLLTVQDEDSGFLVKWRVNPGSFNYIGYWKAPVANKRIDGILANSDTDCTVTLHTHPEIVLS